MPRRKERESNSNSQSAEGEVLDEQFENYVRVAYALIPRFKIPNDTDIAEKTILKCKKLHAKPNIEVKRWVQDYFKFFLKALFWTSNNQHKIYEKWYPNVQGNVKTWLTKNKSFMAMNKLDGGAVIVYIAISNNPCSGWQDQGLKTLMEDCASSK